MTKKKDPLEKNQVFDFNNLIDVLVKAGIAKRVPKSPKKVKVKKEQG
ncbi:MAG: hypothetical protein KA536_15745 [Saprospiraceae bacterium]|nr:hypothetical protein [Saprospiraceae bacterium]